MDCMAVKALKSSFLSDVCAKSAAGAGAGQQAFVDDVWCVTGLNNVSVAGDDFSVDDLLDFTDKEFKDGPLKEQNEEKESNFSDDSSSHRNSNFSSFSETDDFGLLLAGELTTPADNLENLEWLSQIVDDTQSEMSLLCPVGVVKDNKVKDNKGSFPVNRSEPAVYKVRMAGFPVRVPVKARSKRSRPNGRVWTGSASLTTTESSTTTSSSSYGSTGLSPFVFSSPVHDYDLFFSVEKPAAKKQRRKPASDAGLFSTGPASGLGFGSTGILVTRRCSHCQVQKTPQWRTGPMGPKTLCNACGVRYKSGRLFPEYRPACSPTFSQEAHSNSHRKVLEMRRKKETVDHVEAGLSGLNAMVPSF